MGKELIEMYDEFEDYEESLKLLVDEANYYKSAVEHTKKLADFLEKNNTAVYKLIQRNENNSKTIETAAGDIKGVLGMIQENQKLTTGQHQLILDNIKTIEKKLNDIEENARKDHVEIESNLVKRINQLDVDSVNRNEKIEKHITIITVLLVVAIIMIGICLIKSF